VLPAWVCLSIGLQLLFAAAGGQDGVDSAWMQADSPFAGGRRQDKKSVAAASQKDVDVDDSPRCPARRHVVTSTSCASVPSDHIQCRSDSDCAAFSGRKCCHDGCRLACLVAEPPPPCMCLFAWLSSL